MRLRATLLFAVAATAFSADPVAFPGAEGFGAHSQGGRGGKVLVVRNLNDSGPGSFRQACEADGPRIVVFRVAGIIDLRTPIEIVHPYLTVAGQTAPGDGICLRGQEFSIRTHDVIVRFLRSRPGDISGKEVDAMNIGGDARDVILDHCSATWSVDECLSPSGAIANVTVQWCIIAEGLNRSVHHKGAHGYGSLVRAIGGVTLHHNLWAHQNARSPRLGDNYGKPPWPVFDVRNNVIYDWGSIASGMTGDVLSVNYVGNYLRPGPSSNVRRGPIVFTDSADAKYYLSGNVAEHKPASMFDRTESKGRKLVAVVDKPFEAPPVETTSAEAALRAVLANAGATRPVRDAVDARIVREVELRTGSVIDSQSEVGGWPVYRSGRPPLDSNSNGLPDAWEKTHGSNIEDYMNALAAAQRAATGRERKGK